MTVSLEDTRRKFPCFETDLKHEGSLLTLKIHDHPEEASRICIEMCMLYRHRADRDPSLTTMCTGIEPGRSVAVVYSTVFRYLNNDRAAGVVDNDLQQNAACGVSMQDKSD